MSATRTEAPGATMLTQDPQFEKEALPSDRSDAATENVELADPGDRSHALLRKGDVVVGRVWGGGGEKGDRSHAER